MNGDIAEVLHAGYVGGLYSHAALRAFEIERRGDAA